MEKNFNKFEIKQKRLLKRACRREENFAAIHRPSYYETQANLGTDYRDDPNNTVSTDEVERAISQLGVEMEDAPLITRRDAKRLYKQNFGSTAGFRQSIRRAKRDVLFNGTLGRRIYGQRGSEQNMAPGEDLHRAGINTLLIPGTGGRSRIRNNAFYLASGETNRLLNQQISNNRVSDYIDKSIESQVNSDISESNNELYKDINNWNISYEKPAISTADIPLASFSADGKTRFMDPKKYFDHKDGDEYYLFNGRPSNVDEKLSDGRNKYYNSADFASDGDYDSYHFSRKSWGSGEPVNEVWLQRIPKQ